MGNVLGRGNADDGGDEPANNTRAEVVVENEVERVNRVRLVAENMPEPDEETGKKKPRLGWSAYSKEEKADAVKKFNAGASTRDVAKSMREGCSSGNVSRWRKQAEAEKNNKEKKIAEVVAYLEATQPRQ